MEDREAAHRQGRNREDEGSLDEPLGQSGSYRRYPRALIGGDRLLLHQDGHADGDTHCFGIVVNTAALPKTTPLCKFVSRISIFALAIWAITV